MKKYPNYRATHEDLANWTLSLVDQPFVGCSDNYRRRRSIAKLERTSIIPTTVTLAGKLESGRVSDRTGPFAVDLPAYTLGRLDERLRSHDEEESCHHDDDGCGT